MTFDIVFVLALTLAALVLFALDRLRLDQVAMAVPVVLLLSGILTPAEAVSGLASRATVTVGSMLVLGLGLRKTGLVSAIGAWARTAPLGGKYTRLFALCLICAFLSPFLMTTAVVMVFIPVFIALAEQAEEPASRYLMPLSFVSILGGTVTLMGTSTNLVVHGEAMSRGYDELGMFSITPLGLICLAVGLLYLFTAGRVLLPRRVRPPDLSAKYDVRRFVTELHVPEDSRACGRSLAELGWGARYDVTVLDIERDEREVTAPHGDRHIRPGDILYVRGSAERLLHLARRQRLTTPSEREKSEPDLTAGRGRLVEVLVAPGASLVGRTLRESDFGQRYDATVLAIQKHGVTVTERLAELPLRVGDLLLVHGTTNALERLADDPGFVPMAEVKTPAGGRPRAGVAAAIMAGVVLSASLGVLDIMTAALTGVGLMVFTRCVHVEEIYSEVEWLVIFVLAGLIPLGVALETTGAAELLAGWVVTLTAPLGQAGLIAAFYLVTAIMTAIVSNAATAVMLTPVAILAATQAGVNPYALLVAVMFGASASFVTPFGYQTNVMIYGPGGYRFSDFMKVGGLLNLILLVTASIFIPLFWPSAQERRPADTVPTLGLDQGVHSLRAGAMRLDLVTASQTVAALRPEGALQPGDASAFDFTPFDWLERRAADGYFHLGDLTLRLRWDGSEGWRHYSTAAARRPVESLPTPPPALAAADLAPTLPPDLPLRVRRYWESAGDHLALRFELHNPGATPVEIGALGIPMVFNNILTGRSLDEAHAVASFHDPYIGRDAGYLQVTRLSGHGPVLLVVPLGDTPFEAYNPLLDDPTPRSVTFEGFHEWMAHSRAHAEDDWSEADPWNPPTSATLAPGETRSYGVRFLLADEIRAIEPTLLANGRPVAVGVPGYVVPMDIEGRLFLKHDAGVRSLEVEPAGALTVTPSGAPAGPIAVTAAGALAIAAADPAASGWNAYDVRGRSWGRARLSVTYEDGIEQTIHYMVIKPAAEAVADLGRFLTTEQWFEVPDDPFGRSPSVISYDYDERRQVTEDNRAWIAGIGDEGGSGSWLAAIMKQLVQPDPEELAKMQRFVDEVVWGGLQYAEGDLAYGVRKSMFYYEPDDMPEGTYSEDVGYGGWSSWDREHAMTVGRSYNYPHVAALHWVLYRLARNHEGLVTNHPWDWYLDRAWRTGQAMVEHAGHYSQFGQMGGTVFLLILLDLQREGWTEQAATLEETMRARAEVWRELGYPYGSEMPWDSTGQEEVYAWCRYFGFDHKALVTLNAILAYTPAVPHWGYNGSARRYWDFVYAGKLRRIERQLHHYGSALNTIPVLVEYRARPDDLHLLRVGHAGMMGGIANITQDGFGPSAFHAYPSTLRIDGYSGDYGPGFLGHAINTGTYVVNDPELGWLAFGGNLSGGSGGAAASEVARRVDAGGGAGDGAASERGIRVVPLDAARSRVYLAPLGLWLTLDAGTFEAVELSSEGVRATLSPATATVPNARLRVEQPAQVDGVGRIAPDGTYEIERGAYVVPLGDGPTVVVLEGS